MSYASLNGGILYPEPLAVSTSAPGYGNNTLSTSGYKAGMVFESPITDTIVGFSFRTGTVTTGGTVDCRVETVDPTTGFPTGTLWGTNTNIGQALVATTDNNGYFNVVLTAAASITKGDLIALVIVAPGSFNAVINVGSAFVGPSCFPCTVAYTGTWSVTLQSRPCMAVNFGTNGYYPINGINPFSLVTTINFNSGSTPDVYGNRFALPFGCKVSGAWYHADIDSDIAVKLYDTDGVTVLASYTNDAETPGISSASLNRVYFDNEVTLTATSVYRIGIEPTSVSTASIYSIGYPSSGIREQNPGYKDCYQTSAKNPSGTGSWTDDNTKYIHMGLIISQIDSGGGSSGGSFIIGM